MGNSVGVPIVANELLLRRASKADLDDITRVAQAGFPDDPEFNYRFPHRHEFPEDNWKYTRLEYEGYLDQPKKFAVLVVTSPVTTMMRQTNQRPIALAVWDMAVLTEPTGGGIDCGSGSPADHWYVGGGIHERRDANPAHMKEFAESLSRGFQRYFAQYGNEQVHLWLLATHPDFRRRGAGRMLCNWGKEQAKERGRALTVLASPMGKFLYQELGYEVVGSVLVQVKDEDEKLEVYCLEQQPPK